MERSLVFGGKTVRPIMQKSIRKLLNHQTTSPGPRLTSLSLLALQLDLKHDLAWHSGDMPWHEPAVQMFS